MQRLVVIVNKMDDCHWQKGRYAELRKGLEPFLAENMPGVHSAQTLSPAPALKLPGLHSVHSTDAVLGCTRPAGQIWQVSAPTAIAAR